MRVTHFDMLSSAYSGFVKYLDENTQYQQYINSLQVYLNAKIFRWQLELRQNKIDDLGNTHIRLENNIKS